jgi:SCP-2 sterol transfer family protein
MSLVPSSPGAFFTAYIPARFAELAGFEQATSAGSVLFTVPGAGQWSYRLAQGKLLVDPSARADVIVCITVPEASFAPIVVAGAERLAGQTLPPERQLLAFRALTLDSERAAQIRAVAGSVAFAVVDGVSTHRVYVTPGAARPNLAQPECEISCDADAFWGLQSGTHNPIELLMGGKLRIAGDAQIPMALSGLFV